MVTTVCFYIQHQYHNNHPKHSNSISHKNTQLPVNITTLSVQTLAVEVGITGITDKLWYNRQPIKICKRCSESSRREISSLPTTKYTRHTSLVSEQKCLSLQRQKVFRKKKKDRSVGVCCCQKYSRVDQRYDWSRLSSSNNHYTHINGLTQKTC